ncbi:MAG: hypothetical protein LIP16_03205 [Clostridium sp.]|nr:hypothetical protein [Clostridium sp.]
MEQVQRKPVVLALEQLAAGVVSAAGPELLALSVQAAALVPSVLALLVPAAGLAPSVLEQACRQSFSQNPLLPLNSQMLMSLFKSSLIFDGPSFTIKIVSVFSYLDFGRLHPSGVLFLYDRHRYILLRSGHLFL